MKNLISALVLATSFAAFAQGAATPAPAAAPAKTDANAEKKDAKAAPAKTDAGAEKKDAKAAPATPAPATK